MSAILKAGMVGLDTSHCQAFLNVLHDPANPFHVPGVRVAGVYPGGSQQFSLSRERVGKFSAEIEERYQLPVYASIPELVKDVDVLFLSSVDGRQHPEQFAQMAAGKPVFIDKPFAVSAADAAAMLALAEASGTPLMSCSALRYAAGISELAALRGEILACEAHGPTPLLADYPGYFWYGIHAAEMLFLLMGRGCQSVRVLAGEQLDVIQGAWRDGRSGLVLGSRYEGYEFGCLAHTKAGARLGIAQSTPPYYAFLLKEVVRFFQSGQPPIDPRETLEIIAFLDAANRSRDAGGIEVRLGEQ